MLCHLLHNQRGAIFGLDARIALAIFAVLSIVGGATAVLSVQSIQSKSLAKEMVAFGEAMESLHHDLDMNVYDALITPSDQAAFTALYDNIVVQEGRLRGKWLGPYINVTANAHPQFGQRVMMQRRDLFKDDCGLDDACYLWLAYGSVKKDAAEETNLLIDGRSEQNPAEEGRVQWTATEQPNVYEVGYRVGVTMNSGAGFY